MATLKYEGNATFQEGTVGSDYTSGGTSLVLTSTHGGRFPANGDFWIRIDSEILKVTARTSDTLTVVGAQDGTSAANHSTGATVRWVLDLSALDQLRQDIHQTGAIASASAEKAGNLYLTNNSLYLLRDTGAAFTYFGPLWKMTPPPSAGWSWDNQGSSTIDSTNGYEYLSAPKTGATAISVRYRTAPSTPYTITAAFLFDISGMPPGSSGTKLNSGIGLCFRDAAGKLIDWRMATDASGPGFITSKWTTATSFSAAYTTYQSGAATSSLLPSFCRQLQWMRIEDDNTNLKFYWSIDGFHWKQFDSRTRTDFFASGPNAYGFFAYNNGNAVECALISLVEA